MSLLSVENLSITLTNGTALVQGVDLQVEAGQTIGLVGESGSGKSITAYSILQLLRDRGMHCTGRIDWQGQNLITADEPTLQRIRGREMAMIFQEPMSALNPLHKVHRQIAEAITLHQVMDSAAVRQRVMTLLEQVGLGEQAERIAGSYPHQLSGGQRQRVAFGRSLIINPQVLLLDEPFGALDTETRQAMQVLLKRIMQMYPITAIFVTHDLKEAIIMGDTIGMMEKGQLAIFPDKKTFIAQNEYVKQEINFWQNL